MRIEGKLEFTVTGGRHEEIVGEIDRHMTAYGWGGDYHAVFTARPLAETMDGEIAAWKAEVEAMRVPT